MPPALVARPAQSVQTESEKMHPAGEQVEFTPRQSAARSGKRPTQGLRPRAQAPTSQISSQISSQVSGRVSQGPEIRCRGTTRRGHRLTKLEPPIRRRAAEPA